MTAPADHVEVISAYGGRCALSGTHLSPSAVSNPVGMSGTSAVSIDWTNE